MTKITTKNPFKDTGFLDIEVGSFFTWDNSLFYKVDESQAISFDDGGDITHMDIDDRVREVTEMELTLG